MNEGSEALLTRKEALKWFINRQTMSLSDRCQEAENWAIKALKVQEPRVMTLDEVRNSEGKALFLECCVNIGGKIYSTWCSWALYKNDDTEYCVFADTGFASNTHHQINKYGKEWRCWTAKPTDEQRATTPWETPKEE